ncbi:MAG TPA: hypothetical protein VIY53_07000 [Acidobacteriaceae bacterium]
MLLEECSRYQEIEAQLAPNESVEQILQDIDPQMIAIGLALAALAPGPAGEVGAVAAIAFDFKRRRWDGVILSTASMVPLVGYVPALVKVALLIRLLNRRLKSVEAALPALQQSPGSARRIQEIFGKYQHGIPKWRITRAIRDRLDRIVTIGQGTVGGEAAETAARTDRSTPIP